LQLRSQALLMADDSQLVSKAFGFSILELFQVWIQRSAND
jgi:hypothetical protein